MPFLKHSNGSEKIRIFYQDYGKGDPVILLHGWPLSHQAWEGQISDLVDAGYRVIAYDRRGFGKSSQPCGNYDYSTLTVDLRELIVELDLQNVTLVGFSMGGGEVVRYFTDFKGERVIKAALIASIIPLVAQKDDNPDGVPQENLNEIVEALSSNRIGFLKGFHENFYNFKELKDDKVSQANLDYDFSIASHASPIATLKSAEAWATTDFRNELQNVSVPTLIIHGDADNIVPYKTSAKQAAEGIENNEYHLIPNAPHGLNLTHREEVNKLLLEFLKS
ncbi:pimeloyl-ACP methyl ester carboxylesterase [Algoriphagus ratkowskyi]|uniref:Alpha/beta hydrolase n=1 Tax=Algoriphagus ratkowskyi TaxID=57028 RepID=A0A2W7R8C0_9BACT|nr:alpha/beta hydrolase [Algoriphagus ratkowskyi]PZX55356.1 pimeloyl-ACP methyl ester carboxylesterase [Algoriphagus ratkowskyi]TXD79713.1 alpha/beta hydrolase [Algoriphagus ratkowskyi]